MFDLNLKHRLPSPFGHLDSSAVLSFQWGRYQELTNIYSIATSLAKLHSYRCDSYTIIANNEVDNFHNHIRYTPANGLTSLTEAHPHTRTHPTTLYSYSHGSTLTLASYT
jgi:hypothetical protein